MARDPRSQTALAAWLRAGFVVASATTGTARAQTPPGNPSQLPGVVVTATRTEAAPFDVPASIDRIGGDGIRDAHLQVNISESLGGVPGLMARDRQNYAQDVQISVRGFGARSTFGIRGVRLYVDGIPATLPDGQGQISNVDLGTADRIEILRGPFSALYGNSSGGVIQVFTEEGRGPPTIGASLAAGSWGTQREALRTSGSTGGFGWVVGASEFKTDGYRDHSAAERRLGNAKLTWQASADDRYTLVINSVALPEAQDPLGLSRAQFDSNPRSVDPSALQFNTRKTVDQTQLGFTWERRLTATQSLRAMVYDGHRNTQQFQAIPVGAQASPLHPGGVIVLGRDYSGVDVRWAWRTRLDDRPFEIVAGLAYDKLDEHRQGYQNFVGPTLGVEGALRRDEDNRVSNTDPYVQGSWNFAPRWTLNAGVRHSSVHFDSADHYIVGPNPDDSGSVSYSATLPVAGLMFAATDHVHVYVTGGRGFETPTLNELAYRPNGQTGLNLGLQAATSKSLEAGVKWRDGAGSTATAAVFETHTDHEIVTQTNTGGRATFQNAGATRRRGLETQWARDWGSAWHAEVAYTWLDARYRDPFMTCTATPCSSPNLSVASGNRIPGIARDSLYGSLGWLPTVGWRAGVEARTLGRVYVNDVNSDAAAGFATVATHVAYVARLGAWTLNGFGRVDNLFDRRYAGSVIVNEGNARYFEPAPTRAWSVGGTANLALR
jgi:iron complex outermembrane receptor protein